MAQEFDAYKLQAISYFGHLKAFLKTIVRILGVISDIKLVATFEKIAHLLPNRFFHY